jgi:hypothetical protein
MFCVSSLTHVTAENTTDISRCPVVSGWILRPETGCAEWNFSGFPQYMYKSRYYRKIFHTNFFRSSHQCSIHYHPTYLRHIVWRNDRDKNKPNKNNFMGKLRKGQLFISLSLVSYYTNVRLRYLIWISPYVIHDSHPNDRTQNEN